MKIRTILLGAAAIAALSAPARADDAAIMKRLDAMQHMIDAQQHEIQSQKDEIHALRRQLQHHGAAPDEEAATSPPAHAAHAAHPAPAEATTPPHDVAARLDSQQAQIDALSQATERSRVAQADRPVWSFANGRPTVTSPDGRFSLYVRALGQFDMAYYMQGSDAQHLPVGSDLSSGANFRRAQLGIQGMAFGDWSYLFNYEFGGSGGTEGAGRVQSLYAEYDGLAPVVLRVGAYPPPLGLEDNTSAQDTIFLERAAPSDVLRNTVGGDGRDSASVIYAGDRFYATVSYTGAKVADPAVFDEQSAVAGRVAGVVYADNDARIVVSASGAYAFKIPDTIAGPDSTRLLTLSSSPEITVDSTGAKLISTGAINTENATIWGVETGAQLQNLYAQAGYFGYAIDRRQSTLSDPDFNGWYVEATWVLTGEPRGYSTANAAFTQPKPRINFSPSSGGWGAWEIAARYDDVDFNYHEGNAGVSPIADAIRGGDQKIWTVGLNWYPNTIFRIALDYQHIDVDRLGTIAAFGSHVAVPNTQIGQDIDVVSLRSQIAF